VTDIFYLTKHDCIKHTIEEEDSFIYQLWAYEGHEYSHTPVYNYLKHNMFNKDKDTITYRMYL